jgi:hypothetical protein
MVWYGEWDEFGFNNQVLVTEAVDLGVELS